MLAKALFQDLRHQLTANGLMQGARGDSGEKPASSGLGCTSTVIFSFFVLVFQHYVRVIGMIFPVKCLTSTKKKKKKREEENARENCFQASI